MTLGAGLVCFGVLLVWLGRHVVRTAETPPPPHAGAEPETPQARRRFGRLMIVGGGCTVALGLAQAAARWLSSGAPMVVLGAMALGAGVWLIRAARRGALKTRTGAPASSWFGFMVSSPAWARS